MVLLPLHIFRVTIHIRAQAPSSGEAGVGEGTMTFQVHDIVNINDISIANCFIITRTTQALRQGGSCVLYCLQNHALSREIVKCLDRESLSDAQKEMLKLLSLTLSSLFSPIEGHRGTGNKENGWATEGTSIKVQGSRSWQGEHPLKLSAKLTRKKIMAKNVSKEKPGPEGGNIAA